jgi:hypothetical protein
MNKKLITFGIFSFFLAFSTQILLTPERVFAHVLCKIITPWGWEEACPHPHLPSPSPSSGGQSCLAVMSYPQEYNWSIKNSKDYLQSFWLNDQKYNLEAENIMSFRTKIGRYSTNSCNSGTYYPAPIISFDRYVNDNQFTEQKFKVDVTHYRSFYFWRDGNVIRFVNDQPR